MPKGLDATALEGAPPSYTLVAWLWCVRCTILAQRKIRKLATVKWGVLVGVDVVLMMMERHLVAR